MKIKGAVVLLAFVLCLGLAGGVLAADKITWKLATVWPKGTILQKEMPEHFANLVNKMSNGRLEIKVYAAGQLVGALEVLDAVKMGTIDAFHGGAVYWMGKVPASPLFCTAPFNLGAIPHLTWMYERGGLEMYQELYAGYNVGMALPCGVIPTEDLAWSHKPIETMDDFKGLKFRTTGWWGEILTSAGASVIMLPAGEVYEAIQRKVLDAGEFSTPSMDKDLAFYEIAKYVLGPGVHQIMTMLDVVIAKKSWDALSPDLQEMIKVAAQATTLHMLTKSINADIAALKFFDEKGVERRSLPPEVQKELKKKAFELIDKKAEKDPLTKKVWESQQKFRADLVEYEQFMKIQAD